MKTHVHLAIALALVALSPLVGLAQTDAPPDPEEVAVRAAVDHYLRGHATGEGAHHAEVFHPVADLYWIRGDTLNSRSSAEYIANAPGEPAADEDRRSRWIEMVDVTGSAAVAKIVLDYPRARIVDYMALLKIDGEWKIVNKIFDVAPSSEGR
ncbi:MAG: nuclear transport factor 2 family protein [Gemmatimonadota bacterium]|nr:nuclear transport factor 2 family protein [Gemmatimonadota bacterium]